VTRIGNTAHKLLRDNLDDPPLCVQYLLAYSSGTSGNCLHNPEFPFCFPGYDSIPPIAAAAIFFRIRSNAKDPDAPGRAFAGTKKP
jgi:hypothetical protein